MAPATPRRQRRTSIEFLSNASPGFVNAVFAFMAITGQVGENITLPLLSDSISSGSDPYFVLFFGSAFLALFFHVWLAVLRSCTTRIKPQHMQLPHKQMFLVGLCTSLNGLLVVYASPTSRTSAFLQALLYNFTIPMTIGFRFLILRKAMTWRQAGCAAVVMLGIFVALIPTIFSIDDSDDQHGTHATGAARILWPLCFMVGFAPGAIWNVLQERNLKPDEEPVVDVDVRAVLKPVARAHSRDSAGRGLTQGSSYPPSPGLEVDMTNAIGYGATHTSGGSGEGKPPEVSLIYFLAWTNTYMLLVSCLLFWTDFVPNFGMAADAHEFVERFSWGFKCIALQEATCHNGQALSRVLSFGLCYVLALVGSGLLVRHSDGANYLALVQTLTTPIGALFWTLCVPQPLAWNPTFTITTWFSLGGLLCMIPGIVAYNNDGDVFACLRRGNGDAEGRTPSMAEWDIGRPPSTSGDSFGHAGGVVASTYAVDGSDPRRPSQQPLLGAANVHRGIISGADDW